MLKNALPIIILFLICFVPRSHAQSIRKVDLAGSWYPGTKAELSALLNRYLNAAHPKKIDGHILAVISPHAGYPYSAPIAAYAFKAATQQEVKTVVIVGFSHRKMSDCISVYDKGSWRTPLGDAVIDEKLAKDIIAQNPRIKYEPGLFGE